MKKLGLVLAVLAVCAGFAMSQTTIFSDNMESLSGWTLSPTSGWTLSSTQKYSGTYSARCDDVSPYANSQNNYMTRSVSLSGYTSATLKFYIYQTTESGYDYVYAQYLVGTTWTTAWSRAGSYASWAQQSVTIPSTATSIRFYFKSDASVTAAGAYIDDVVLTATGASTPTLAISSTSWAPVAAGATSSAINVTNSGTTSVIAYTVSSNQTWLTVSSASGNTPGSFTMTAAANTGAARSATVTVTATTAGVSGSPKTLTVSQAAAVAGQNDAGTGADAGNDFATATLVSSGSWTGCYLDATDRNDYYKFNVTSGQVIKVKITPPSSADYDLYLYNPSQTQVGSSTAGTGVVDSVVYTATVSGTFYAKAYEYSGTGNYSLLISAGGTTPTTILAVSSTSWAPVAAGGTSSAINVTNSGTSGSVIAYTVSSNQTWLTVSAASGNTPGSFTMTAAANSGAARSATVTVAATGQTSKTIAVSQAGTTGGDTYEPNETVATAYGPLTSGTTYNSYIYTATDVDYYKLNVTMAGAITVTLQNLPGDYDLYLYSTDGTTQLGSSTASGTTNESISYTATAAGTYYVKVIGYSGAMSTTVAYALNATYPTGTPTPTLAISTTSWAPAQAGATSSAVNVTNSATSSVIAYTVSSNQSWLTVSAASGNTPGSFTMTATANSGSTARTATVTVTATTGGVANSPQTINVNQAGTSGSGYEWTIMVYLNGDNNLEQYGFTNFNQMAAASQSSGKYRIVVQFDRSSGYDATNGNWTTTKRFLVTPGMTATAANQVSDIGEADMGSPTTLSTFANWAIDNYPANHYFLVFWDHGGGWTKSTEKEPPVLKDFSNDDSHGSVIGIANGEFASAMSTITSHLGRKLDVIGWDCCLMGMPEVIDISKEYADVAFVSEETEAGTGWNYTPFLNAINSNPTISGLEMLKALINGTGSSGLDTQADVDLTKVAALNTAISTFADQLMAAKAAGYTSVIHTQEAAAKPMYLTENRDLWDFANRISTAAVPAALVTAASGVKTAINNAVYYYLMSSSFSTCHGLAIYLPLATGTSYSTSYNSLPFAANTHWDEYVKGQTSPTVVNPGTGSANNTRFGNRNKPLAFELNQAYPSPAVKNALISFQLDKPGYTALKVYNMNGQLVKTLFSEQCGTGWHEMNWDLKDNKGNTVSAGVYMYTLQNGTSRDSKRLIVVK